MSEIAVRSLDYQKIPRLWNDGRKKEIWTFGGGKGGVGKSLVCANTGICLSQKGFKVLMIDADFGAANLHTYVGLNYSSASLSDFLLTDSNDLNRAVVPTAYNNLFLIPGGEDPLKISNPRYFQVHKLLLALEQLDFDHILIDLGAGTTAHSIDIFTSAKKSVLICMPEPAAIENTYRFVKYSFLRKFRTIVEHPEVKKLLDLYLTKKQDEAFYSPQDLLETIQKIDPKTAENLQHFTQNFTPALIMNMVRNSQDMKLGFAMCQSSKKYFGIDLDYVGFIESDDSLAQSVKSRRPVVVADPFSKAARGIKRISDNLLYNSHA